MAQIGNSHQTTANDGLNDYVNIDTLLKQLQILNGAVLRIFSDNYTTEVFKAGADAAGTLSWGAGDTTLKRLAAAILGINGALAFGVSATTPDPGAGGTIATSTGVSRVTPAAARTGIILAAGQNTGQVVIVQNEGSLANSITFAASGTSNVSDGTNDSILGGQTAIYEWNGAQSLWFRMGNPLVNGGLQPTIASATAPDPGAGGTVNTANVGRARVSPAANRTACVLQAGTFDGQEVWVVNEAAANTIAWATQATSNIGGESGGTFVLAAKGAQKFTWDANDSLWHKAA